MDDDTVTAWRDWQRLERCLFFGLRRWLVTIGALVLAWIVLIPIAGWLFVLALMVIMPIHEHFARRSDKKLAAHPTPPASV